MRILDIDGNELQRENLDFKAGYIEADKIFKTHHEEIPGTSPEWHYKVLNIYFTDGTKYTPISEEDPQIRIPEDPHSSKFEYIPKDGEEPKQIKGMSLEEVIDVEGKDPIPAWDEYEEIERYFEYSKEEKEEKEREAKIAKDKEELLSTGLDRLAKLELDAVERKNEITDVNISQSSNFELAEQQIFGTQELLNETGATVNDLVVAMADLIGIEE